MAKRRIPLIAGISLTARGWAFLGASSVFVIAAYAGGTRELLYVAALLAALPIIGLLVLLRARPRMQVTRVTDHPVTPAGHGATVTVRVTNLGARGSLRARWTDPVPWREKPPGGAPAGDLPPLRPRGVRFAADNSVTMTYSIRPPQRGLYPIGPLRLDLFDAFELVSLSTTVGTDHQLIVIPEVVRLGEAELAAPVGNGDAPVLRRRVVGDDDDSMTREYRSGDALRRVHWRASARHGGLMVRQEEQRSFPRARVVVDTLADGYGDWLEGRSETFEWVVRMLASVAVHLRRHGFLVTIDETAHSQIFSAAHGSRLGPGSRFSDPSHLWDEQALLTALATMTGGPPGASSDAGAIPGERSGIVIAIVGSAQAHTIDSLVEQRGPGEVGVVFMVSGRSVRDRLNASLGKRPVNLSGIERLAEAGWTVAPVVSDTDPALAWATALDAGEHRGIA